MSETKKVKGTITGPGNQAQIRFNEDACSDKVSETGLNYFYGVSNAEGLLGALGNAIRCGKFKPIYVFNTAGAVAYVAFGDTGVAAPTSGANGVPIPAGQGMMLSSGQNEFIRASAATVFGFVANENVIE